MMKQALNNGLLVDPHDENAISNALLKLVAGKNLWQDCRINGLKSIHKFSWPEHCRNYLSQVEQCRNRHPTNQLSVMPIPEEPLSESLRGLEDLSLKDNGDPDPEDNNHHQRIVDLLLQKATSVGKSVNIYCPGRRQRLFVIAVDSYNSHGSPTEELPLIIKNVMQSKCVGVGFVLLTGLSLQETKETVGREVKLEEFDALACSSGSEICYPWMDLVSDEDYESHIEYHWPGENVKSIVTRLANVEGDDVQLTRSSSRCYSYSIRPGAKPQKIEDLKQRLRMRGLRCNMVYTQAASRLNVIPLFASRAQALSRYLSVRWSIDLPKVILFTGERGDTDYNDLLRGVHMTIVLRNSVVCGSEMNGHSEDDFKNDNGIDSKDNTKVAVAEGFEVHDISKALDLLRRRCDS